MILTHEVKNQQDLETLQWSTVKENEWKCQGNYGIQPHTGCVAMYTLM